MNEVEWLSSQNPWGMVNFLRGVTSKRKFRLFGCGCCRQVLNPFAPPLVERAVAAAEAFADGEVTPDALARVRDVVTEAAVAAHREDVANGTGYLSYLFGTCLSVCSTGDMAEVAQDACHAAALAAADAPWPRTGRPVSRNPPAGHLEELTAQADLLRDIIGNPFSSYGIELEWRTDTVIEMAKAIYVSHAFDQMPVLADALQDAGCDSDEILGHCRNEREHVRGCWVVDVLLGKN